MNYDQAREEMVDGEGIGIWRWTTMNDGRIREAGNCDSSCKHPAKVEAERHFYDYCLGRTEEISSQDWNGCAACDTPTKFALGNRGLWMMFKPTPLCDTHRTNARLEELHPFSGGMQLVHS